VQNVAFKHRIRLICRYRHCNALHFDNKRPETTRIFSSQLKIKMTSFSAEDF